MARIDDRRKAYVNRSIGAQGLNTFDPAHVLKEYQMVRFENAIPIVGGFKSAYGYQLFNQDGAKTGGIKMIHGFSKSDGTKQLVFAHDDDYYYLAPSATSSTAWSNIGDYGTASDSITAYTFKDFVLFGSGVDGNNQKKWNGSTFSNVTTPIQSGKDVKFYEFFQGQDFAALFAAGHPDNPSTLYYSDADDPDVWSGGTSGTIDIALNDGFKITGLKAQGDQLIVYKEKNRYYVSTFYESNAGVYGVRVSPFKDNSGGAINHETIQVLSNGDIVALAGQYLGLQGVGKQQSADGSLIPKEYSRDITNVFEDINWSVAINTARSVVFDNMLWMAVPLGPGATANNYVIRFHLNTSALDVMPDLAISCWEVFEDSDGEEVLYAGSADTPAIYKWNKVHYDFNGAKITTRVRTGRLNLGSIFDNEYIQVIALEGFKQFGDTINLKFYLDGVSSEYQIDDTFFVSSQTATQYLSTQLLSVDYLSGGNNLQTSNRWIAILLPPGSQKLGREVEVEMWNENTGAYWGGSHLSINEISVDDARNLPPKFIINTQS